MSSCDDSCCMCCPVAFIVFVTMGIANNARKENLARARELLQVAPVAASTATSADDCNDVPNDGVRPTFVCSHCGTPMVIVQTLMRERAIRAPPQSQSVS